MRVLISLQRHAWLLLALGGLSTQALAQTPAPAPAQATQAVAVVFNQEELDQLMAPVALYPDTLLMQVLVAATYPLEVVAAERFINANSKLKGEALTQAAESKGWDLSVVSLLQFPSVVAMMNDQLEWTQRLGDAFLAQQGDVMDTVQALRTRAQQAGNLQSTAQQKVVVQEKIIVIEPAQPQVVYVPYYNPIVIYGPWWHPARPPWFWMPPPIYRPPSFGQVVAAGIFWGVAIGIRNEIWNDYRPSWRDRRVTVVNNINIINVNVNHRPRPRPGGDWRHDPVHRKGVAYRDNQVRDRVLEGSAIRPSTRPQARPGAIERLPSRGDDNQLRPHPSQRPETRPAIRPDGRPDGRPDARPAFRPEGTGPAARPSMRPETRPAPRPESRPQSRPMPQQPTARPAPVPRPSGISPGPSRDVVRAQADRGRASREAMARPAPRPAPRPPAAARPAARPAAR